MHSSITVAIKAEFVFFPCMIAKQLAKILPQKRQLSQNIFSVHEETLRMSYKHLLDKFVSNVSQKLS